MRPVARRILVFYPCHPPTARAAPALPAIARLISVANIRHLDRSSFILHRSSHPLSFIPYLLSSAPSRPRVRFFSVCFFATFASFCYLLCPSFPSFPLVPSAPPRLRVKFLTACFFAIFASFCYLLCPSFPSFPFVPSAPPRLRVKFLTACFFATFASFCCLLCSSFPSFPFVRSVPLCLCASVLKRCTRQ